MVWLDGITKAEAIEKLAAQVGLERPAMAGRRRRSLDAHTAERMLHGFLDRRGWPRELAIELDLSVTIDAYGHPRVRFPFRLKGEVVGYQDRAIGSARLRWLSPQGQRIICPYEADRLDRAATETGEAMVVEGVSDTVAIIASIPDAVVVGIPGVSGFKAEWAPAFAGLRVWIVGDSDAAGETFRARCDTLLAPVAKKVLHLRVPACFHDVDSWRQAAHDNGDFAAELLETLVLAEAGAITQEART